jgi:hypothetical protein
MRTALLRAAAVITVAATPAIAQRAATPHLPSSSPVTRVATATIDQRTPHRTAAGDLLDVWSRSVAHVSPAVDPSRRGLLALGPGDSVGYTYYDLQTNAAMPDRIINWPDDAKPQGVITSTLVWTASVEAPPATGNYAATTRGTYGAIHDGESWSPMRGEWTRLEDALRTGFVELDRLSDGRIVFANHSADMVHVWVELEVGSGQFYKADVPGSERGLWASLAITENDEIHVIWTYTTDDVNEDEVFYSRSLDGGNTFSQAVPMTGPESIVVANLRSGFGANSYAIAARGTTVAIWYLTSSIEVIQLRSDDKGETWPSDNAIFAYRPLNVRQYHTTDDPDQRIWPDPAFDADTAIGFRTDTIPGPGSALDLMVDADGNTHGVMSIYPTYVRRYYPPGGDTSASTYRSGIIYQATYNYPDVGLLYVSQRGDQIVTSAIAQPGGLDNTGDPSGYPNYFVRRAYHGGYSLYPQLGMDASKNVYLTFTSGIDGDVQQAKRHPDSTTQSYLNHHVFVTWMRTDDEERRRWMAPRDLTPTGLDAKYAALADLVDDELHIAYQIDRVVGEMIPDTLAPIARERNNVEAMFLARATLSDPASVQSPEGAAEIALAVTPNPAVGDARIALTLPRTAVASVSLVDALGRTVAVVADDEMAAGTYHLTLPTAELTAGVYYLVARVGGTVRATSLEIVH